MNVRAEAEDGIVWITLDRPAKRNAMTDAMWAQLHDHLDALDPGGRDRVLVITGAGESFCGGSDVGGLLDDPESLPDRIEMSNRCVLAMHELSIPTVALVDGVAAGSGANLALACDLVYATERARFAQLFIRRGLSLDSGASWLLPRLVGERRARELCLLGGPVSAAEALTMGMINRVFDPEALVANGTEIARSLAQSSPVALAGTKQLLNDTWDHDLDGALRAETFNQLEVITTDTARQNISSFGGGAVTGNPLRGSGR
ncbi:enoyl-CoA hydratase-related protein [Gordonia sp. ABSL1-1]|uniref:enoyl-CoA hydratase/isomerase family protein n=1 Tax=Gordonia sp. ABSL1-1 TaxID=3053923 RepID=UPI0025730129|nr:enoyl-CoA hydratase-related protein [Gordonia sp. ABSL1-1]MDL9935328.1 enoyl-CoA hydratase-related protein [Gordonia sp. ABSL1-1]